MRGSTVGLSSVPLSLATDSGWLAGAAAGLAESVSSSGMFASQVLRLPTIQPEKSQAKNRDLFAKATMTFLESHSMRLVETHEMDCVGATVIGRRQRLARWQRLWVGGIDLVLGHVRVQVVADAD